MKRIVYGVLITILLITLTACGSKRQDEYPEVFGIDGEPKVLQEVYFVDPAPADITPKTKTYLDVVTPDTRPPQVLPEQNEKPVDIFNLSNEVKPPMGCTAGVDC